MQLHRDDSHHHTRGDSHDRTHAPIDCVGMKAALSAYLDDELTRAERFEADSHLVGCAKCRTLVEREAEHAKNEAPVALAARCRREVLELQGELKSLRDSFETLKKQGEATAKAKGE
jgi:predicted anti-sigma-YlaC factor YlaD